MTPDERIAKLEAENARQQEQITALLERVHELEARLANATKDSHSSHKPPSSDPLGRKRPRSQRRKSGKSGKSGKKPGGQLGHRGETLHLVALPDEVVEHRPTVCAECQMPLDQTASVVLYERRQVRDLPEMRLVVREHRALHVRCPQCAQVSVGKFPPAASSRVQYGPGLRALGVYLLEQQLIPYARVRELFTDLLGAPVSLGTLTRWVQQGSQTLEPVEEAIKGALTHAPVLHNDESGVRRAGSLAWAHVSCTSRLTHYAIHPKRGSEATDAMGILPHFTGVSVHDGWKPYRHYTSCRHALCNIHHLREVTFLEEAHGQAWAKDLKALLLPMKTAVEAARLRGETEVGAAERTGLLTRYEELLANGLAANPPPERQSHRRGRVKQSPARNLLERLLFQRDQVLAFLADFTIPFDNNQAEQDLRMLKVQQKIAGSFRANAGSEAFARIRGYLSSMRKQGVALLAALQTVFTGQPLYPAFD